jgi:hypothetical protein
MLNPVNKKPAIVPLSKRSLVILQELHLGAWENNLLFGFRSESYDSFLLSENGFERFEKFIDLPIKIDLSTHVPRCLIDIDNFLFCSFPWSNQETTTGIETNISIFKVNIYADWFNSSLVLAIVTISIEDKHVQNLGHFPLKRLNTFV